MKIKDKYLIVFLTTHLLLFLAIITLWNKISKLQAQKPQIIKQKQKIKTIKHVNYNYIIATITAYTPRKIETDHTPYIAASGKRVKPGTVAVSRDLFWNGWTFGKKIYIQGLGIFTINDLMNKKYKKHIDIFMYSYKKAKRFGKRYAKVILLQ